MKALRRSAAIVILLVLMTATAFADYTISWPSEGSSPIIGASSADVKCGGQLNASAYLLNTGENVSFQLIPGATPPDFMGRGAHNRSAKYLYQGICEYMLRIEGKDYLTDSLNYSFSEPGDYEVRGYITYRWQTKRAKAGFPKYYYKQRIMSRTIRVSDLEDAVAPEQPGKPGQSGEDTDEEEEMIKPTLKGMVSHTEDWEKNRNQFNAYCRASGNEHWQRESDVFWSGEKFRLAAVATGKEQPQTINVKIRDHPYQTTLHRNGNSWEGVLFDKSMIDRWGRDGPETLQFVFSAVIDGSYCEDIQRVIVDDLHKYWLMHRKE
ncbi:hypothetical protein [Emergencia sp.]|uniref:hypothetical protein n=1 Tax=Emergencia sp. TaxID=1926557 RepID=UPI003AF1D2C0